jgi:hypothetical protein
MRTVALGPQDFERTFVAPMHSVTAALLPIVDVWTYVQAIPAVELGATALGEIEHIYRAADGAFNHVLISTNFANVYLVIAISRDGPAIHGHHVLDLNSKYGLSAPLPTISPHSSAICREHHVVPAPPLSSSIMGIAVATLNRDPLSGMRSNPEGGTCGWYIWGGEPSSEADFFQPLHASHVAELCPKALPFLSLPPGWRFLLGANSYVDVWYDETLLDA